MKAIILFLLLSLGSLKAATIKVGSSPVISSAGIYLAESRGYFKEQGLEVEVTDFANSGASMTALLSKGELDIGAGNLSAGFFNAIANGQQFKVVADKGHIEKNKDYISLLVRNDHVKSGRFKTLKDLKGFKMGLTSLDGVSQQIVAERFLTKAGLKPSDVEYIKLSYAEMNIALKSKNIDATIQLEPFLTKAVLDDIATIVADGSSVHPRQQSAAILYSVKFMKEKPEAARKFMTAYLKGVRDYNDSLNSASNKEKVINDLKKYIKIDDEKIWNNMRAIGLTNDGSIDSKALMEDIEWYFNKKYIDRSLRLDEIVDNSYIKWANDQLHPQKIVDPLKNKKK